MAKAKTEDQLLAEEAAKKAAAEAEAKKKREAEEKAARELQAKVDAAMNEATAGYNVIEGAVSAVKEQFDTLHEGSLLDEVKAVEGVVTAQLKTAKEGLKAVKAAARKVKDNDQLKTAVAASEDLVSGVEATLKDVKGRVSAAREATKAAEKAKRDAERAEKKRLQDEERARKAAEREAKKEPEQNGIRKPGVGTLCRAAWDIFDAVTLELGQTAPISYVLPVALDKGLNEANVKAEYARWKKYMGITGRVSVPVPANIAQAAANVEIPSQKSAE